MPVDLTLDQQRAQAAAEGPRGGESRPKASDDDPAHCPPVLRFPPEVARDEGADDRLLQRRRTAR